MEPRSNPNFQEPRYSLEIAPDFDGREDDTNWASEGPETWTDAREGRDELGRY